MQSNNKCISAALLRVIGKSRLNRTKQTIILIARRVMIFILRVIGKSRLNRTKQTIILIARRVMIFIFCTD